MSDQSMDLPRSAWFPDAPPSMRLDSWHKVLYQQERYMDAFEETNRVLDSLSPADIVPRFDQGSDMEPWLIEAPFSAVEVLENILKPSEPLKIYTARHIRQERVTTAFNPKWVKEMQRSYREYRRFQGRLEQDREISFVCLKREDQRTILNKVWRTCWPVRLFYISIPLCYGTEKRLVHPWAIVLRLRPPFLPHHTYENRVEHFLAAQGIPDCKFERSLLKPGTTPLPESVLDWLEGVPGTTGPLPYYMKDENTKDEDVKDVDIKDEDIKDEYIKDEDAKDGYVKDEDTNDAKDDEVKDDEINSEGDIEGEGDSKAKGTMDKNIRDDDPMSPDIKGEDITEENIKIEQPEDEGYLRENSVIEDERMNKRRRVI